MSTITSITDGMRNTIQKLQAENTRLKNELLETNELLSLFAARLEESNEQIRLTERALDVIKQVSMIQEITAPEGWQIVPKELTDDMRHWIVTTADTHVNSNQFPVLLWQRLLNTAPQLPGSVKEIPK